MIDKANFSRRVAACFKFILLIWLAHFCHRTLVAQTRLSSDKVLEKTDARPGTTDTAQQKKSVRFQAMELNQRYGVQQVGEVMADAVAHPDSTRKAVNQPESLTNEAASLVKAGKFDRAVQLFNKALKLQPNLVSARQGLGYALIQTGDFNEAVAQYREAIALEPKNAEALLNLGVALYRGGNIAEALTQYQRALTERTQPFPAAHFNLAMAFAHTGEMDKAIEHYQTAIAQRGKIYPEAHNNLGLVYEAKGNLEAAQKNFQLAIEQRRGNYPLAHYNMARIYQASQNDEKQLVELQLAIKQQPDFPEAYLNLANVHLIDASLSEIKESDKSIAAAKLARAMEAYRKAITLREGFYPLAHEELAVALTLEGKHTEAYAEYRIAFDQYEGKCPATLMNLVRALSGAQQFSTYNELSLPDNAGNLANKRLDNQAHNHLHDFLKEGLKEYEELEDNVKDNPDVHYCVGLAYTVAGDLTAAAKEFSRAIELKGGNDIDAKNALDSIRSQPEKK